MKLGILSRTCISALLVSNLAACNTQTKADPALVAVEAVVPSQAAQADATIASALQQGPFPGISVAVARDGKVIYARGDGFADVEKKIPVTPETRFPVGSITKSMTCYAVQDLAAKGKIDTSKPIGAYLTELPAPAGGVAIHNLLDHTSGIPNYLELPSFPYQEPVNLSREQMVSFFAGLPLRNEPGASFNYSNSNTFLLGLLIEAVSGTQYDAYLESQVFEPFGMQHAGFDDRPGDSPLRAHGYNTGQDGYEPASAYDWLVPFSAGAVVASTSDLIAFIEHAYGQTADPAVLDRLLAHGELEDGSINAYAQGCLVEGNLGGIRSIGHSGSIYGFSSHYAYYPERGVSVVVLTNGNGDNFPALTLSRQISRIFLDIPPPDMTDHAVSAEDAAWIVGNYDVGNRRLGLDRLGFVADQGVIRMIYGGVDSGIPGLPLIATGSNRFVSPVDPEMVFTFSRDKTGTPLLVLSYYDADMPFHPATE
jgi:CubicO group peptidase (beta-lactamase class C family)